MGRERYQGTLRVEIPRISCISNKETLEHELDKDVEKITKNIADEKVLVKKPDRVNLSKRKKNKGYKRLY